MNMPEADERLRSVAGLVLKNNAVAQFASWPGHVVDYVKQIIMSTFHDQPTMVRNSAGGVIVAILDMVGPAAWPEVLQLLLQSLDSPSIDQQLVSRHISRLFCSRVLNSVATSLISFLINKGCVQCLPESL